MNNHTSMQTVGMGCAIGEGVKTLKQSRPLQTGDVVRFNTHWQKHERHENGMCSGQITSVLMGDVAVVMMVEKKGDKRPFLRFPGGGWCWANNCDIERVA